jgi:PPOX class probable FMN-dependent enzyme
MQKITTEAQLNAIYGEPNPQAITKVTRVITPLYQQWIQASRFVVVASVGPEGTDLSPRGEIGSVVSVADEHTVLLPDWLGNNRIDTLRNIVRDSRVSVMFMTPGSNNVVRANGTAIVTTDPTVIEPFSKGKKQPRSVVVITIQEMYFQCAKALMRSQLWSAEPINDLPTAGDFLKEQDQSFDSASYDQGYPEYAKSRMW